MATHVIVSYDDSPLDRDALALGAFLSDADATLTLAYVRHAPERQAEREHLAAEAAEDRLRQGAARLGASHVDQRVVVSPSTPAGLTALAAEVQADVITFGSEYRTPLGHIGLGRSAQTLLENGPAALALAPAGYDGAAGSDAAENLGRTLRRIGILPGSADEAAFETAHSLAERHGAVVTDDCREIDLLVVGSRPEAREGRVMVSSSAARAIEEARAPVLVTARGVALSFRTLAVV
jgi:nucleotide-binding universal stress UspA family protein